MDTYTYSNEVGTILPIERIDFDVLGNDEIKRLSVLRDSNGIEFIDLYDNSEPKRGGLIDPRMGTTSNDINCATCGLGSTDCVGHSAHITLATHVYHIGYLPWVLKILQCVCLNCSKLLVFKNEDEITEILKTKTQKERLVYIKNACKNVTYCQKANSGCGAYVPKIREERIKKTCSINIIAEIELDQSNENQVMEKTKTKLILTAEMIYDILKNISDDDCRILGLDPTRTRPEYMIHKELLVPPVQMRPSAREDFAGGMSREDDLTKKLADIVKRNLSIIKAKESNNENSSRFHADHLHLLQYHVATYMENESIGLLKSEEKGRIIKSVASRIKSKHGRIRGNLMGKRGDFTARTVITSDPSVRNNELRVPVEIAMNLTFPEVVNESNIEELSELVRRGRDSYPGANFVFTKSRTSNKRISQTDLRYKKEGITLHIGDIVERHLRNGDTVLLNRQPSLHKSSLMAFKIKVLNDRSLMTFGLSVSVCTAFNAD